MKHWHLAGLALIFASAVACERDREAEFPQSHEQPAKLRPASSKLHRVVKSGSEPEVEAPAPIPAPSAPAPSKEVEYGATSTNPYDAEEDEAASDDAEPEPVAAPEESNSPADPPAQDEGEGAAEDDGWF